MNRSQIPGFLTEDRVALLPSETRTRTGVLIKRWLDGDSVAMERVAASHLGPLQRSARRHPLRRLLRADNDPDDIAGDTWLRVPKSHVLSRFQDRGPGSLRRRLQIDPITT